MTHSSRPLRTRSEPGAKGAASLCGGCRSTGMCRLGLTSWTVDVSERASLAEGICPSSWHAGPGVAFGGWTAAVFDDVLGRTVLALGELPKTASLHVNFRRPVPVDTPLSIRSRVVGGEGRRRLVLAEMRLVEGGLLVAMAEATMVVGSSAPTRASQSHERPPLQGPVREHYEPSDFIDKHLALRSSLPRA